MRKRVYGISGLVRGSGVRVLFLLFALLLFSWPYLQSGPDLLPCRMTIHLFAAWALVILILFLAVLVKPLPHDRDHSKSEASDPDV